MIIGVVGSRNPGKMNIHFIKESLPKDCSVIVSGGALGVDCLAEECAHFYGIEFIRVEPNYAFFGKQAPLVRNTQIVKQVDKVFAFWDFKSRGTAHTISECIRLNVPIEIIAI